MEREIGKERERERESVCQIFSPAKQECHAPPNCAKVDVYEDVIGDAIPNSVNALHLIFQLPPTKLSQALSVARERELWVRAPPRIRQH